MGSLNLKGINHIAIRVSDIERAVEFYIKTLGARLVNQSKDLAFLWLGETDLTLERSEMGFDSKKGFVSHLGFAVDSAEAVDKAAQVLKNNKVSIEQGPADRDDARYIYFRDLDETLLSCFIHLISLDVQQNYFSQSNLFPVRLREKSNVSF